MRKLTTLAILMLAGSLSQVAACKETPRAQDRSRQPARAITAFPGAEGYGAASTGGRGGKVLHVTTLADDGEGSLRWALGQSGPRIIVFDLSGAILLKSQILVENGDVTIAGQTAPGEGITLEGSRLRLRASNIIVRGLHFRPGDGPGTDPGDRDGMMIGTQDQPIRNIVVDRNSFTWAIDENLTINGAVHDVTLSNNIIAEGLSHSLHPKGEHSKGLLVSNWASTRSDHNTNITIIGNLLASNSQRNPEVRAGQNIEIINNLSYNYGLSHMAIYVGGGTKGTLKTTINIIGNVFKPGPSSPNHKVPIAIGPMGAGSRIYLDDNLWTKMPVDPAGNQYQGLLRWDAGGIAWLVPNTGFGSGAHILDSRQVVAHVLAHAGTAGFSKNSVDARIIRDVRAGAGRIIDRTSEVGGMPGRTGKSERAAADTDRDGMPDWFEDRHGLDKTADDSRAAADGDGFTNIEAYINGIISGFDVSGSP